jgi:acetolactate synthase I/II/III large subunit
MPSGRCSGLGGFQFMPFYHAMLDVGLTHTMSGKASIPCTHPLSLGLFGRSDRIANGVLAEADSTSL